MSKRQLDIGTRAECYKRMFDESKELWACTSIDISMEYIVNNAVPMGYVKRIKLGDMGHIQFTDSSLLIFKSGDWVEKGYYTQTQKDFY